MDIELKEYRIFRYMLVLGLAIVFLAILMIFSGTNAQADVIVDQSGGGDYLTIQEGIDNAIPGENIFVLDGSYNENITIDKNLQLLGNGSATTKIDGFGTNNNIINITAEGVEITGFNITESGMWYGIWADVGGFNIHDNVFETQNWAIYMDINRLNSGSTTVGDIIVDNNEVIGTHGFQFNIWFEEPLSGSDFIFGDTIITNNTLHNTQTGIEIDRYTVFSMDQGSVTWGDILVKDNFVSSDSYGIFFWGIFWNITDVNIDLGKMNFSGNNLTSGSIYIDWWDFADGIYGNTLATVQDTQIYDNDIVYHSGSGITLQTDLIGDIIYDSASITTGDFFIYSNNITTTNPFSAGIGVYMSETAHDMYNDSSVNYGNIYIDSNIVDSNGDGIYFDYMNCFGTETYDNAQVDMGDVQVTNNEILSTDHGVYIFFNNLGITIYDQASATLGNFIINNNNLSCGGNGINIDMDQLGYDMHGSASLTMGYFTMDSNNITSVNQGINIQGKNIAQDMHNDTIFSMGDFTVNNNTVNSTGSMGINFVISSSAYTMTGNAIAIFGNFHFTNNNITATTDGISLEVYQTAYNMYNDTRFSMGNIVMNPNTIDAGLDGIEYYIHDSAYDMYGSAYAEFGTTDMNGNVIYTGVNGIYINWQQCAAYMNDYTEAHFGDVDVYANNVSTDPVTGSEAIYLWYYYMGWNTYDNAYVTIGTWDISSNIIPESGIGMFLGPEYTGYNIYGNSQVVFGDWNVLENTVNSTNEGIIFNPYNVANYLYDSSRVTGGNYSIQGNNVTSLNSYAYNLEIEVPGYEMYDDSYFSRGWTDTSNNNFSSVNNYGAYIDIYEIGTYMYGNSQVYYGDIAITDNEFWSTNSDGLYLYQFYQNAYEMYDNSYVQIGDVLVNDNTVNASGNGIYLDTWTENAYNMFQSASADLGNFEFNRNIIEAGGDGIFGNQVQYWAYNMFGDNNVTVGNWQFNNNTINANNNGIYWEPYEFGAYMYGNSTAIIGNNFITGNEINVADGYGLYAWWWYYFAYEMYDNSTCIVGDSIIIYNVINVTGASTDSGIWTGPYDSGENVYDDSTAIFGDYIVSYNTINAVSGDGIQFSIYAVGYNMDGFASITTGNISVSSNIIDSTNGNGIYISDTYENGYNLFDNATLSMGNIEFIDNQIEAGINGIYIEDFYNFGYNMNGNSSFTMGNINFTGNTINASNNGNGITFNNIYGFGSYMYDNSMFEMGDFNFIDNIINANFYGIYFEPYYFGAYMYGNSTAIIGNNFITGNEINVADSYGLYVWWWYYFAYEMYDNSTCMVGDSVIRYNVINVTGSGTYGIYTGPYDSGYNVYGNSKAIFGDYIVSYNTINANNLYGIWFDFYYTGYEMHDNSNVTFGQFQINNNNITTPNGTGLFVNFDNLAYNVYDNAHFSMNNLIIANNVIIAQTTGIDISYNNCGGLYHTSTAYLPGIIVIGNTVDSSSSSFNYFTSNTPANNDPGVTQVWGDVILDGNDFDAGMFGVALNWQNQNASVAQPEFYISNTDIHDGSAGSTGLLLLNITDVYAERVTIDNFGYGIFSNNSNVHFMLNGSIANCAVLDISLYSASYLFMINSTFDNASVYFEDLDSLLEVAWFMNVLVQSQVALPVPEAIVAVADIDGTEIFNATANTDGQAFFIICMEYRENITGIIKNYNEYTANASKSGAFGIASPNPTMDHTQLVIITLIDNIPPSIFSDNSDTSGTTGDPFYFEINASDNMGIVSVRVNYRPDGVGMYKNLTMNGTGPYWLNEGMPSDYVGFIEYYFTALDSGGFWVNTTPTTAPITDNDAPTVFGFSQPTTGTTGESVWGSVLATDNIGITYYKIDVNGTVYDLVKDGDYYNFTIDIPSDSLADIDYFIILNDSAGNNITIPGTTITITDNDEPTYTWVLQPTTGLAGGTFKVSLMATDNIGITNYTITINGTTYDMVKDGDYYNFTFNIPPGSTEDITYNVTFMDNVGNPNTTADTVLTITDVDIEAPNYAWILQPMSGTTGESVMVSLLATDNLEIVYYKIEIDGVLYDMIKDGDYYNYTINIPSDSLTDITYKVIFNDSADNPAITPETTITITDNDAPTYNWISQPTTGTAGDSVLVSLQAFDNIGITSYKIEIDGTSYDLVKDGDYFNYTINLPPGSSVSITYDITFKDDADNQISTGDTVITVTIPTDTEPPEFTWVLHPEAGTTGDSLLLSVMATDNIGITYYKISVDGMLYDLVKDGNYYNYTINIPSDSLTSITYYVVFNDSANNPNTATSTVITVTDNDPASISNPASDTSGEKGKDFRFQIDASDNIGISEVKVWYWFGDDDSLKKSLILIEEDGTYSGSITPDESGTLHYYFEATDTAGNTFQSDENTVSIGSIEKEDEEEPNVIPFIIIVIIIIIVLLLFLLTRKRKETEEIPEVEEGVGTGEVEEEVEEDIGEGEIEEEVQIEEPAEEDAGHEEESGGEEIMEEVEDSGEEGEEILD